MALLENLPPNQFSPFLQLLCFDRRVIKYLKPFQRQTVESAFMLKIIFFLYDTRVTGEPASNTSKLKRKR